MSMLDAGTAAVTSCGKKVRIRYQDHTYRSEEHD